MEWWKNNQECKIFFNLRICLNLINVFIFLIISLNIYLYLVNVKSSGVQKKCAIEWNELDLDKKEQYFQTADEINKSRSLNKMELIEDINKQKNELNKQIKEL